MSETLQKILTEEANRAAQQTSFIQREREFSGAGFVQTLVFGWLGEPKATLEQLAQSAANLGISISSQGLEQRFTETAANCLQQVLGQALQQLLGAKALSLSLLKRFKGVYVLDSTTISLPVTLKEVWRGCGGGEAQQGASALKVQVLWNLSNGELQYLSLQNGCDSDNVAAVQQVVLPASSIRIADLGYFNVTQIDEMKRRENYVLSRFNTQTGLYDQQGKELKLLEMLQKQGGKSLECTVLIGRQQRVEGRLLAVPVPQEVADQRRRRLKEAAQRKGRAVSARTLALANWTILITTAPSELLGIEEALILLRLRWQVELLFKLWKSQGLVDEWRSKKIWRILCEVYAKLLGVLVQHWIIVISNWSADLSLVKAGQSLRQEARSLGRALVEGTIALEKRLEHLAQCLAKGCRLNKRKRHPSSYQLLLSIADPALS